MLHQGLRVASVLGRAGEAEGAGDADQLVVDKQRLVQGLQDLCGDAPAALQVGAVEQHGEFVAGEARQDAIGAQAVAQAPGQADQQFVAGLVAEAVVDPLEVVDVHQQQAERRIAVAVEALFEGADEVGAVAEAGEVVGVGQFFDALLGQLALGDIFVDADVVGEAAVLTEDLGDR
ncbi:hypothetical protein D3C84_476390 [compost metagenome]